MYHSPTSEPLVAQGIASVSGVSWLDAHGPFECRVIVIRFVEVGSVGSNGTSNCSKAPESAFHYLDNLFSIGDEKCIRCPG